MIAWCLVSNYRLVKNYFVKRLEIVFNVGVQELVQWSQPHKAVANTECLQTITINYKQLWKVQSISSVQN